MEEREGGLTVWNCTGGPPNAVKPKCQLARTMSLYRRHDFMLALCLLRE